MDVEDRDLTHRIDTALERIHAHADEDARGFTSHAPMVVDALAALGRADRIDPFLDGYLGAFHATPGERAAAADAAAPWVARLDAGEGRSGLLDEALAELAPCAFAAATHGLIRVAHAVRMLDRADTPVRRHELARALAYWRASAARLPGEPGSAAAARIAAPDLIAGLEVVPPDARRLGLFSEAVAALDDHAPFAEAIARLDVPPRVDGGTISALTGAMLEPYLESPLMRIAYVHTITAPSALRLVAAHLRPQTLRRLYAYAVQAVAALHAISRLPSPRADDEGARALARDPATLASRAADTLEEHVIKLTEACLREHAASGDGRFLVAAADATLAEEARAGGATA